MYYMFGQCKGLGIGGIKDGSEDFWYVVDKDVENNVLIVVQGYEYLCLMLVGFIVQQLYWVDCELFIGILCCMVKICYCQIDILCMINVLDDDCIEVIFDELVVVVMLGQFVVFYSGEVCLGGGIIEQ